MTASQQRVARERLRDEARAWREVSEVIDGLKVGGMAWLCNVAKRQVGTESPDLLAAMLLRVGTHLNPGVSVAYCCHHDVGVDAVIVADWEEQRQARILAALFLALECESEAASLRPSRGAPNE